MRLKGQSRAANLRMAVVRVAVAVVALCATSLLAAAEDTGSDQPATSVKAVFDDDQTNQYVLDIEAALARAQAAHGAIPKSAAEEITRKARIRFAPHDEIAAESMIVEHRMVALLNVWRRSLAPEARQYAHYGATTVDIYDTALTLQLRESTAILIRRMRQIESILIKLARANQDAVMPGRTLGQHALPITFGKKASTWVGENRRNIERLKLVLAELSQSAILKGAVGTYAGLGDKAIEIEHAFAKELGLPTPYPDDWHGSRDVYANYALTLSLISRSFGDIGQEIFLLQMTDINEVDEHRDAGSVSSSSMAQKVNPRRSEMLIQAARVIPRLAEVVLDDVVNFFERDNTSGPNAVLEEISIKTEEDLKNAHRLLEDLDVNRDAMRADLERSKGLIMAQRVAFALSPTLGKDEADKLVHDIARRVYDQGIDFRRALLDDPTVAKLFTAEEIDRLMQPSGYLGRSADEIEAVIAHAEALRRADPEVLNPTGSLDRPTNGENRQR